MLIAQMLKWLPKSAAADDRMTLPLFPLKSVNFPGGLLQLKVFELRYVDMVKRCLAEELPFGVCLIREGEEVGTPIVPEAVGCLATIRHWEMPHPNLFQLTVLVGERFQLESHLSQPDGLLVGQVRLLQAEPDVPLAEEFLPCANLLKLIVAQRGTAYFAEPLQFESSSWVSQRLAEALPLRLLAKQKMLELIDPQARLGVLRQFLLKQGLIS